MKAYGQAVRCRVKTAFQLFDDKKKLIIVVAVKKQNKWKSHKEVFRHELSAEVEFI